MAWLDESQVVREESLAYAAIRPGVQMGQYAGNDANTRRANERGPY